MNSNGILSMKTGPILILLALLLVTGANLRAQTRVLVLGGSQPYQSWAEAAFPPSGIATNLQGILQGDSAISQPVTVQCTDTYQTNTMWVSPLQKNWTFESKTLMSWFYWPNNHASTLALLANNWNYVVMMDDPHVASIFPEYHLEGVLRISQAVRQAGGTPVLAMTWSSGATPVSKFGEMAYRVGDGAGAIVAPAGYAWNNVSAGLKDAGTRPTARGAYVTAATVYSRLYNRSAKTSSFIPAGMTVADRDAIADVAMATVQAEATTAHYTGKLRRPTHFASRNGVQSLVKDRAFLYHYYQSSTENGINGGFDDFGTALPACWSNMGVIPTHPYLQPMYALPLNLPGPVQFCYSREFDLTSTGWFTNPEMYANYACFDFQDDSGTDSMVYGMDRVMYSYPMPEQETGAADVDDYFMDLGEFFVPVRVLWARIHEAQPQIGFQYDGHHMQSAMKNGIAAIMSTLLTGRCPVGDEPPNPNLDGTDPAWQAWFGRKTGYEIAWQHATLNGGLPGLEIRPTNPTATQLTSGDTATLTVRFRYPPASNVTVNVSVDNPLGGTFSPYALIFTPQNYAIAQTVTVAGLSAGKGLRYFNVLFNAVSDDVAFNGLSDQWGYNPTGTPLPVPGTWIVDASGAWSSPGNWLWGTSPAGTGVTAYLNYMDITADRTIHLDSPVTLGALVFGDLGPNAASWTLDNNGNAANVLTLDGILPTITVNAMGVGEASTVSAVIAGTAGLTKSGIGTLSLGGANIYTGTTTLAAGTLQANNPAALGNSGNISFGGGALQFTSLSSGQDWSARIKGSTSTIALDTNGQNATFASAIDGSNTGGLTKIGAGTLTLSAANAYSGPTTAIAGVLLTSNTAALPGYDTPGNVIFNGGAVAAQVGGSGWTTGQVDTLLANAFKTRGSLGIDTTNGDLTQWTAFTTSNFGGALGLTKVGPGTLTLNQANTYTGPTLVSGGTLVLANSLALQNSVIDTSGAGTIILNVTTLTIGGLNGSTNLASALGTGYGNVTALSLNPAAGVTSIYSGNIANGSAGMILTKSGAGTQVLAGTDTYTGATRVAAGMLQLAKQSALYGGTSTSWTAANLAVASGATLAFNVGGVGEFTTANVNTLVTNLAASTSATTNGMAAGSTLGFDTTNASGNSFTISNVIANTTGTAGGARGLTKLGANTLVLSGANTYNGTTTVNAGTLTLSGASGALALSASPISLAGGLLNIGNGSGSAGTNNNNRIADTQAINLSGGSFALLGSGVASTPTTETVGAITQGAGADTITVKFAGTTAATTLTATSFGHSAGNATTLISGVSLGKDTASTTSVARFILTAAPTLVGTTAALSTGINSAVKNTQIVPYLVGEATSTTGGLGTATGIANTFLTYNATTGLRPLNLTDEFTQNATTSGNNTRITAATTASTVAINSLVMNNTTVGGNLTITDGQTLTDTSGAILFVNTNTITPSVSTGILDFGAAEAMVTVNGAQTGAISAPITGSGGLTKSGLGVLALSGTNIYTGTTTVAAGILSVAGTGSLPGWDTAGNYTVASGATLAVGNAVTDGNITTMLAKNNFASGAGFGFDTTAGNRTYTATLTSTLGLAKIGTNVLTLTNAASVTGLTLDGAGSLALQGDVTTASLNLQNSTGAATTTGSITIASGKTLTVNGPVRAGHIVNGVANSFAIGGSTNFVGMLAVSSPASDFSVGDSYQSTAALQTLDMSALGTFTATINRLKVGCAENSTVRGVLKLANTNTITASSFEIATGLTGNPVGGLELGAVNTFNVDAINLGSGSGLGQGGIMFASALPSSSTVTIRGRAGGLSTAILNESWAATSSATYTNQVDFTGGVLDAKFGTSTVAQEVGNQNSHSSVLAIGQTSGAGADFTGGNLTIGKWNGNPGTAALTKISGMVYIGTTTGTATMAAGAIKLADNSSVANTSNATGTYVSGILTIGQNASLTATSILLGQASDTIALTNAAVNLNKGGTLTIGAGGLTTAKYGTTAAASTLSFDGGVLKASSAGSLVGSGAATLAKVTVLAGGGTIDSNGYNVSVDQAITAGVGNGISSLTVNTTGNGYVVAPYVQITDATGTGASAFAKINSAGQVSSIVVTNAGQNYSATPTITLMAGTVGTPATANVTLAPVTGGGLTKTGAGTLTLTAASTYTGATTVSAGTLSLTNPFLASTANVNLAGGALNLAFTGTDTIAALFINGVRQASGTWGAIGSGAAKTTSLITGSGMLNVTTGPFELWINSFASLSIPDRAASANPAGDGLSNMQKFVLGMNPTINYSASPGWGGLSTTTDSAGNIILTFTAYAASGTGYTGLTRYYTVQTTTDLTSWQPLSGYANIPGMNQIVTVTQPISEPKRFWRLSVNVE